MSRTTRDAWRSNGIHIVKRSRDSNRDVRATIGRVDGRFVINSGSLSHDWAGYPVPVFNTRDSIRAISHPLALRRTLPDFIPPVSMDGYAHWHKDGGWGGKNKTYHEEGDGGCRFFKGDRQTHIDGTEYRVLTVGDVIVQASLKELTHGVGNFIWHWCGVRGIRDLGIIPLVKEAVQNIPNWNWTMFGWDVIVDSNRPYVIEINTSPGVNSSTAKRIIQQIERMI